MVERISSFDVNHDALQPGLYISRAGGDIVTWDLRFSRPNARRLGRRALHSIEHIVATVARLDSDNFFRSGMSESVIYFGPMGCGTGFYFILRGLNTAASLRFIKWVILRSANANFVPGSTRSECGSFRLHSLRGALKHLRRYYELIKDLEVCDIKYPSN